MIPTIPPQRTSASPRGGASLAARAFRLQQAFATLDGDVQSLKDLAATAGLDEATAYRILQSGKASGAFDQVGRGRYQLGPAAAEIGMRAMTQVAADRGEKAVLTGLQSATNAFVWLYALTPAMGVPRRVCVDYAIGDLDTADLGMTVDEVITVGRSLRTGASGRMILAHLTPSMQARVFAEPAPGCAGPGVLSDGELLASLDVIRQQGYALGDQECLSGWASVAAPVMHDGRIFGAVLVLKAADAWPNDPSDLIALTVNAAAELSQEMQQASAA
ncbi:IclR family transcriptional regulator C-terminal domain-containing protein [Streptomyces sp. NPDC045369]|uniref:IclR family transcriptional regulator domain-containing protein n=1 Tax=Streptomyces sp. NPDC045369 TaxID=3155732 RepID=UPI0033CD633F